VLLRILSVLCCLIWLYLLLGRGLFWQIRRNVIGRASATDLDRRSVVAIIPARDEADVIGIAVRSLLAQSLQPPLHIFVVDDASTDNTALVAAAAAASHPGRLTVVASQPLPAGWTGKLWALSQGIEAAQKLDPDYFLLTDADILHQEHSVRDLLAVAVEHNCDLASLMVKLRCDSFAERALIPPFIFFFLQLYPPAWTADPVSRTAGAAGGCILIRPCALQNLGGFYAIRNAVIDDCTLASAVKGRKGRLWMGLTQEAASIRSYPSALAIGKMISRSAFSQLDHSVWILAATVVGMTLTYIMPPIGLLWGSTSTKALCICAWLLMTIVYLPTVRFYGSRWMWSLSLPFVAVFYLLATLHSAIAYWRGRGGVWKGRTQDRR